MENFLEFSSTSTVIIFIIYSFCFLTNTSSWVWNTYSCKTEVPFIRCSVFKICDLEVQKISKLMSDKGFACSLNVLELLMFNENYKNKKDLY